VVAYGPCGTGKDHLLVAAGYLAASRHGYTVEYWPGQTLLAFLRGALDPEEAEKRRRPLKGKIVILSDPIQPGSDIPGWLLDRLFGVIDERYRMMLPTWLTCNVPTEGELEEKLSTQIYDRLSENCLFLPCIWPSFRQEQRQQKGG